MKKLSMIRLLLTAIFSFGFFWCSAQKQLLTYQDMQYILQNKADLITSFLKQKDYQVQPSFNKNEIRFFGLYSDADYSDIVVVQNNRRTTINISTTHLKQLELLQKAIESYPVRNNNKGAKIYRIKDGSVSAVAIKEEAQQGNLNKIYTVELEN